MNELGKAAMALLDSIGSKVEAPPDGWVSPQMAAKYWKVDIKTASSMLAKSGLPRRKCRALSDPKAIYYYGPEQVQTKKQVQVKPSIKPISPTHDTKCRARKK